MVEGKIGNYIHYNHLNYLKYGLGNEDSPQKQDITKVLAEQRERILNEVKTLVKHKNYKNIKNKIEEQLNFFRPNFQPTNFLGWNPSDIEKIEKKIESIVASKISANAYDWESLSGFNKVGLGFAQGYRLDKILEGKKGQMRNQLAENGTNNVQAIQDRLDVLYQTLNKNDFSNNKTIQGLNNKLNALEEEWKEIKNMFPEKKVIKLNGKNNNFIKELNKLWKEFLGSADSFLTGEIGEYYAAICQNVIQNKGSASIDEVIDYLENIVAKASAENLGIVGKKTSAVALSKKNFSVTGTNSDNIGISNQHFLNDTFTDFFGGKINMHATQDKVDLKVQLDELIIPASIKNYDLSSNFGIHLHSGKSILSLTQEYCNFMNHYLNITSISFGYKTSYNDSTKDWRKEANNTLKLTMGFKALVGGIYKMNKETGFGPNEMAELFIVNGNDGLYKVYFVDDIINAINSNLSLLNIKNFNSTKYWANEWIASNNDKLLNYNSAYTRIRNLLQKLHEFKLDISINSQILTQI